jgi:hypothetical protein
MSTGQVRAADLSPIHISARDVTVKYGQVTALDGFTADIRVKVI